MRWDAVLGPASARFEWTAALSSSLRAQRSNPESRRGKTLDCFAALAMTERVERASAVYSSLPRVIAMDASVLVRVHSMLSRR
ncbi:hypothetical protein CT676_10635 [Bradyrhizobium sp. MOS001]|nr:hypothetical protein CT676_10635 [Bradyrhizobium sp. MOS001]